MITWSNIIFFSQHFHNKADLASKNLLIIKEDACKVLMESLWEHIFFATPSNEISLKMFSSLYLLTLAKTNSSI